jgi:hypothetical protein
VTAANEETVVYLVGAGSVENAWVPVLRAVRDVLSPAMPNDPELANLQMARLVYLLRIVDREDEQGRKEIEAALRNFRARLASELVAAVEAGTIRARPEFTQLLRRFKPTHGRIAVITTNWDSSIGVATKAFSPQLEVFHLHGCASECDSLYLPTEISDEHYRSEQERKAHAHACRDAIYAFEQATQLVIYGCALSPLDAELVHLLSFAKHTRNVRRAHVVDLNPEPVAKRLATLLEDAWPHAGIHCERPGAAGWELCRTTFSGT